MCCIDTVYYEADDWKQAATPATIQLVTELLTMPCGGGYSSCPGLIGSAIVACQCCGKKSDALMWHIVLNVVALVASVGSILVSLVALGFIGAQSFPKEHVAKIKNQGDLTQEQFEFVMSLWSLMGASISVVIGFYLAATTIIATIRFWALCSSFQLHQSARQLKLGSVMPPQYGAAVVPARSVMPPQYGTVAVPATVVAVQPDQVTYLAAQEEPSIKDDSCEATK
eukprot:SAG31_NODE_6552_length_1980_cov_1.391281_2_plen_226_part_00